MSRMAATYCEVHAWSVTGQLDDVLTLTAVHVEYHEAEHPGEIVELGFRVWNEVVA